MPGCYTPDQIYTETSSNPLDVVEVASSELPSSFGTNPIGEVPEYEWWYGCSPTSGGMIVGYWDSLPGYGNLIDGDASTWYGSGSSGIKQVVASTAHITAGAENGYTYGDWQNCTSYPSHESNPDCMADFMKTVNGGSSSANITAGLEAYVEWDNPNTAINEHYEATVAYDTIAAYGGTFTFESLKAAINVEHPVLLDMVTLSREGGADIQMIGHSIVAYGYQDDMFTVNVPGGVGEQTVGGFAVMDTWNNGTSQSEWVDPDYSLLEPIIDGNGVEWWPWIEYPGSSWVYNSSGTYGPYDWMVVDGHVLDITAVPEPAMFMLLATGLIAVLVRRRR